MAQRRMFSMKVVDTDAFCEMPASAQNLYFHIGMRADDEGFYAGVRGLLYKMHASIDDLRVLIAKGYILDRGDGVYVVKHWKMNNYLQNDRLTPTEYEEKKIGLYMKRDKSYTLDPSKAINPPRNQQCIQNVSTVKSSVEESNLDIDEYSEDEKRRDLEEMEGRKKYKYTREQIEGNSVIAEECLAMRAARANGYEPDEAWNATLDDFAESIQRYEDDKPF